MNLCGNRHEEICFEGNECPLCETIEKLKIVEDSRDELYSEVKDLQRELDKLQKEAK